MLFEVSRLGDGEEAARRVCLVFSSMEFPGGSFDPFFSARPMTISHFQGGPSVLQCGFISSFDMAPGDPELPRSTGFGARLKSHMLKTRRTRSCG